MSRAVLVVGGFEARASAGLVADSITLSDFGCAGTFIPTFISSGGEILQKTDLESLLRKAGENFSAIKLGALYSEQNVEVIYSWLTSWQLPVVLDPVYKTSEQKLICENNHYLSALGNLSEVVTVVTPNQEEFPTVEKHFPCIVLKGGHGDGTETLIQGENKKHFPGRYLENVKKRGTGCRFATAMAVCLGRGESVETALQKAKDYVFNYLSA